MGPVTRNHLRIVSVPLAGLALVVTAASALAGGAVVTVEGGAYFDFVAPDPGAATDGTIRFGFGGTVETIAAEAELVPPTDTNLAILGGGTPTCLEVAREGGEITRLAFVAECTVRGTVTRVDDVFGPGADGYIIGGRVAAPAELVEGEPTFATLIGVPAASGGELEVTFQIDLASGVPSSFSGRTSVTGPIGDLGGGDVGVGTAVLPGAVIDDASRTLLEEAAALGVDATVAIVGTGTIQQKGQPSLEIALTVTYSPPPASPNPSVGSLPDTGLRSDEPATPIPALVLVAVAAASVLLYRWSRFDAG